MRMPSLRQVLLIDAVASGALGLIAAAGAGVIAPYLGLSAPLVRGAGLVLIPWALLVLRLGLHARPPRAGIRLVIGGNLAWVAASITVLVFGPDATALGFGVVIAQALAVAALTELQALGLRRVGASGA